MHCPRLLSSYRLAGPSPDALRALVAAHPAAVEVSLFCWRRDTRNSAEFQAMWEALAAGSAARRAGVPVSVVDATQCQTLQDADVQALCATLPELRCRFEQLAASV